MRKIAPKLMAAACAVFMVLSMWASPVGAEERKGRDPGSIKGHSGVVHAEAVGSVPPKASKHAAKKRLAKRHGLKGVVTAVKDSGFTLETRRGKMIEVSYNDATTFRGGSAAEIKEGARLRVVPVRPKDAEKVSLRKATKVTAKVIGFAKANGKQRPAGRKADY